MDEIRAALIRGDATVVTELVREGLAQKVSPLSIFKEALIPGMDEVGRKTEAEEYYIPEVLLCARAMKQASEIVKPLLIDTGTGDPLGQVVIGTVQGDLHDIGKNLVGMLFEGADFRVVDLGINVPPAQFVEKVDETGADIVAMSALLTTTMNKMDATIEALKAAGFRDKVIVMVGGAPLSEDFAREIGADAFAPDAGVAARLARKLIRERRGSA
jgi:5-methyltetrahydrofolate--homocysteine methyltransferase